MSDWSSFEKEKAYTDRWRLFLEQEEASKDRSQNQFDHGDFAFVYTEIRNFNGQVIQTQKAEELVRSLFAKKDQISVFSQILKKINLILDNPSTLADHGRALKLLISPKRINRSNRFNMVDSQGNPFFSATTLQACFFVGLDQDEEIIKHLRHMQNISGAVTASNNKNSKLSAKDMIKNAASVEPPSDVTDVPAAASVNEGFKDFLSKVKNVAVAPYEFAAEIFRDLSGNKKYSKADKAKINKDFMLKARTLIAMYLTKEILK